MGHDPEQDIYAEDVVAGRGPGERVLAGALRPALVVAAGGAVGALGRWAVGLALPTSSGGMPWSTVLVNLVGCLAMGVLVVLVTESREAHPLVRPFLGVGVLGGFTTFSSYAVEGHELLSSGRLGLAGLYLAGTVVGALLAVALGLGVARRLTGPRPGAEAR